MDANQVRDHDGVLRTPVIGRSGPIAAGICTRGRRHRRGGGVAGGAGSNAGPALSYDSNSPTYSFQGRGQRQQRSNTVVPTTATAQRRRSARGPGGAGSSPTPEPRTTSPGGRATPTSGYLRS